MKNSIVKSWWAQDKKCQEMVELVKEKSRKKSRRRWGSKRKKRQKEKERKKERKKKGKLETEQFLVFFLIKFYRNSDPN